MMTGKAAWNAPRFLAPQLGRAGDEVVLPRDEARHLVKVLRLAPGDAIVLFDGMGHEFAAVVSATGRDGARAILQTPLDPVREAAVPFSVVQVLLKGRGMDDVVRDATMIGASRIEGVVSAHAAVRPSAAAAEAAVGRWHRIALASAKQCRRAVLPIIPPVRSLEEWLRESKADLALILVEPAADHAARPLRALLGRPAPRDAALLIGPEGGWSAAEIGRAVDSGALAVTLGRLTLRADAVALAAGALLRFLWDEP